MQNKKTKAVTNNNLLTVHKIVPIVTPVLKNHNKTILGIVHVIVCNLLGVNPLTVTSLMAYATCTSVYTSVASSAKDTDKIDTTKQVSADGKKLNYVIAKDAQNCLNGKASASTLKKFKGSLQKLTGNTGVIADYFTFYCAFNKVSISSAKTKVAKSDYAKKSIYSDTIKTAVSGVKIA